MLVWKRKWRTKQQQTDRTRQRTRPDKLQMRQVKREQQTLLTKYLRFMFCIIPPRILFLFFLFFFLTSEMTVWSWCCWWCCRDQRTLLSKTLRGQLQTGIKPPGRLIPQQITESSRGLSASPQSPSPLLLTGQSQSPWRLGLSMMHSHSNQLGCVPVEVWSGFNKAPTRPHGASARPVFSVWRFDPCRSRGLCSSGVLLLALEVWADDDRGGRASDWPPGWVRQVELTWPAPTQPPLVVMWHRPPCEVEGVVRGEVLMGVVSLSGRRGWGQRGVMSYLPHCLPQSCSSSASSPPPSHSGTGCSSPEEEEGQGFNSWAETITVS